MKRVTSALRTSSNGPKKRSVVQTVRLSKNERAALKRAARGAGVSVSDYVRAILHTAPTFKLHMSELARVVVE